VAVVPPVTVVAAFFGGLGAGAGGRLPGMRGSVENSEGEDESGQRDELAHQSTSV
jgi:hypothetical protein